MTIRGKCKCCKEIIFRVETRRCKESNKYCLTCGFKKYREKCREERRKALGLK